MKRASDTSIGLKRKINEDFSDYCQILEGTSCFIVCDGMGGHAKGEIASKTACEVALESIKNNQSNSIFEILSEAILYANEAVYALSQQDESFKGMGTTLVFALIQDNNLYYAHVGDSRLYLLRDRKLSQITEDHSVVAELVKAGIITVQEAKIHPQKNEISRAIGIWPSVEPTICKEPIKLFKGDLILLCTDGLTNMVHEDTIQDIVDSNSTVESKVQKLIDEANKAGGHDNITVTLIEINDEFSPIVKSKSKSKSKRFILIGFIIALILCLGYIIYQMKPETNIIKDVYTVENDTKAESKKMKTQTNTEPKEIIKKTPKKKKISSIKYDLSCMSGKEEESMMDLVNLMSQTRDEMVNIGTEKVSAKKEMEYGKTVFNELSQSSEILINGKLTKMLSNILMNVTKSPYTYSIYEIEDASINAFTVGGYIYIHSGMLSFVQSDDELAAVISHEINHNELGHINKKLRMSETATAFVGKEAADIALALEGIATSSFNQKDETMCDLYGTDLMILAGYDPCAASDLWKRMARGETKGHLVEEMMRTHPYSSKRATCIDHHLNSNYNFKCN